MARLLAGVGSGAGRACCCCAVESGAGRAGCCGGRDLEEEEGLGMAKSLLGCAAEGGGAE